MKQPPTRKPNLNREISIIKKFIEVYCRNHHRTRSMLCADCAALQEYALTRLEKCPYSPKPPCKQCPTHCYAPNMRIRIREVMRYSGLYYVKRGRLDWLVRYFMINKTLGKQKLESLRGSLRR